MASRELDYYEGAWSRSDVSFQDEPLVLVDEHDQETGFLDKASAHSGHGILHRAFSLFVFNAAGELLLQQRAGGKRLWPGYWSNTCCSHPRRGESMEKAIHRRLGEELGMQCQFQFRFKFQYQAQFDAEGAENELCWVYTGRSDAAPVANRNEIAALRYISPDGLDHEIAAHPEQFTPWFKIEWDSLRREHAHLFQSSAALPS
ncbi:isopentenyl-diphosphate Delta-isomerase [Dyella silvae]|uniref:isopentenyl-diphosphate Delta-isomerase n=1 Tax=Dyella silvae TaxID=2994424 RepID=UPI002264D846|nr:isopentenyl-diphosphate Delta-isomerase [Dyella silvae]